MRRLTRIAFAWWLALAMTLAESYVSSAQAASPADTTYSAAGVGDGSTGEDSRSIDTTGYSADQSKSAALTDYLKQNRLPLVGGQVLNGPDGQHAVVLYGFVATDFGKSDAVTKARRYLGDSTVMVENRIKVKPELLTSGSGSNRASAPAANSQPADESAASGGDNSGYPGADSYAQQPNETQQYVQQQNSGSAMSSMALPLMLGMMALGIATNGAISIGPGSFGSMGGAPGGPPFAPSAPYNPYPGFPSPPPYGGSSSNFGGSPYSGAPPSGPYGP